MDNLLFYSKKDTQELIYNFLLCKYVKYINYDILDLIIGFILKYDFTLENNTLLCNNQKIIIELKNINCNLTYLDYYSFNPIIKFNLFLNNEWESFRFIDTNLKQIDDYVKYKTSLYEYNNIRLIMDYNEIDKIENKSDFNILEVINNMNPYQIVDIKLDCKVLLDNVVSYDNYGFLKWKINFIENVYFY